MDGSIHGVEKIEIDEVQELDSMGISYTRRLRIKNEKGVILEVICFGKTKENLAIEISKKSTI